jgi:ferredoxin
MEMFFDTEKCTGCRNCEIACSYHHTGNFSRKAGSIKVERLEKEGKFRIILWLQNQDGRLGCDGCGFCLNYCPPIALDELKAILSAQQVGT